MADVFPRHSRLNVWAAVLLGGYAAALALAHSLGGIFALAVPLVVIPLLWWLIQTPARWLGLFFFCALLLPPLPIAIGDSGPHISLVLAGLGAFIGMQRLTEWRIRTGLLPGSMLLLLAALLASVSLATIYSGGAIAIGSFARVLLFAVSVYIFFYAAYGPGSSSEVDTFRTARMLLWAGVASAAFACLDFYFQFPAPAGYGPQFVWLDTGVFRRAQGVFYEASTLGNLCAFFLVMLAVALLQPKQSNPISWKAILIGAPVLSAALVLSYSRASLLNVLIAVTALLYLNRARWNFQRLALLAVVAASAGVGLVYAVFPSFIQSYWTRLFASANGGLSGRIETWRVLAAFLLEHPWHAIVGIGYKTLPYSDFIGQKTIADNMYLSLLVETGIAGLAIFLVFNAAVLRTAWRARASFFGMWIFCFWTGQIFQMLSGDLFTYWRVLPVYFWVLAQAAVYSER